MNHSQPTSPVARFKRYFWQPPRAHGDAIEDRSVSFLELFYDLVYVVVIARAAHHLAGHVTWRGAAEFAVVFSLIWIAWINGALYHDLHARQDGRTRTFVFVQMGILAVLAVFTAEATGSDGPAFATVYLVYLAVLTWLWYSVRRRDEEAYGAMTARYLAGMLASMVVVGVSIFTSDDVRLALWALIVIGWIIGITVEYLNVTTEGMDELGFSFGDALIERMGLFTIIVLGEVVVGVVDGMSDADRTFIVIATGALGMAIAAAYWWTYFDFVGGRAVRRTPGAYLRWLVGHLPATMSIAATGAAMVSLVEHASEPQTPEATAWLLSGAVALGLLSLLLIMTSIEDAHTYPAVYRPAMAAVGASAVLALGIGLLRPAPWLFALLLCLLLSAVWLFAVFRWLARNDPGAVAMPNT